MAKKKRTTKNAAPEEVTLTPELLGRARAAIEKLDADLPYNKAKMWFRHELGIGAGEANALQLQLRAEGFKNDDAARVFLSDTVQSFRGIVRGARTADMMTVVREDDSEKSWPLEDITYDFVLPGDVLELRPQVRYGNTPRLVRVIERTRKRWICRAVKGWKATVWQSVNPFAPVEFNVDASTRSSRAPTSATSPRATSAPSGRRTILWAKSPSRPPSTACRWNSPPKPWKRPRRFPTPSPRRT